MKAEDLTTEHELLMPDKVTWCRVKAVHRLGRERRDVSRPGFPPAQRARFGFENVRRLPDRKAER